jgi:hypothetical protein
MTPRFTRRRVFPLLGALGFGASLPTGLAYAFDEVPPEAATFTGIWTYRSFLSNPDINTEFNKLEFARAVLEIEPAPHGVLRGKLRFDPDFLSLKGNISYGNPHTTRFQGRGATDGTKGWIYDYLSYLVPMWPDGVDQRPAIVGTVIRTVAHSDGKAKAGVVACFIAVRQDP